MDNQNAVLLNMVTSKVKFSHLTVRVKVVQRLIKKRHEIFEFHLHNLVDLKLKFVMTKTSKRLFLESNGKKTQCVI